MADIGKMVAGLAIGIIGIVIVLLILTNLAPEIKAGTGNITSSGLPLAGLFTSIVPLLIMVGALVGIIILAIKVGQGK